LYEFSSFCIFSLLLFVQNNGTIHAENTESNLENPSVFIEEFRSSSKSKIHPLLIQWQLSETPNEFAKENHLTYAENKIGVYIYLESVKSRPKIPPEITVTAFDEKIIVAFVSSKQLDKLKELDFVERVTPPDLARFLSLPTEIPETKTPEVNQYNFLVWIVIGGIVIFIIATFKKRQKSPNQNKDQHLNSR